MDLDSSTDGNDYATTKLLLWLVSPIKCLYKQLLGLIPTFMPDFTSSGVMQVRRAKKSEISRMAASFRYFEFQQNCYPCNERCLFEVESLLPPQQMMIMLGKTVGFVADILKQPQGERMACETQRSFATWNEDKFFFFCQ